MTISAQAYAVALRTVIDRVATSQLDAVQHAARLIAEALRAGGVVQCFGTGHSEAFGMEFAGRAGGLIATNRIALRDIVLLGDAPREVLTGGMLERDPTVAGQLYRLTAPAPEDVFMLASNSGINGSMVEFARLVTEAGHRLIVVTSVEHSARVPSRHPSGKRLSDLADVVLDNGAPYGDAILPLGEPESRPAGHDTDPAAAVGAVSSITAAMLAQMMTIEVVRLMREAGEVPAIYLSANVPGGDEHNQALESRYAGRIRRSA